MTKWRGFMEDDNPDWVFVPIKPITKGRPRMGRRRKVYTPPRTLEFEHALAAWWTENVGTHHSQPVALSVIVEADGFWVLVEELDGNYRPVGVTGDMDNYVKAIGDGLNGVAWDDDRQVQWIVARFGGERRTPKGKK